MSWLAWGFALLAGALITVQAGANSQLKQSLEAPMPALLVNCGLGFENHPAGLGPILGCLLMVAGLALIGRF